MPFLWAVFAFALALYAATTSPAAVLEDDALFIGTLHFFGVAHPPGYPLHTLLGGIFYHLLPFGSPAYKAHLFSGVAAAAAVAAIYAVTALLVPGRLMPLAAALAAAVSKTLWSQAIIAEVYTLNALLFFLFVAATLHHIAQRDGKTPWLPAMLCGLGLANHYPLFILAAAGIALYALHHLRHKSRALLAGIPLALAAAAPFYLWMVWRSHVTMPAHFYGVPMDTPQQFLYYLLRRGYAGADREAGVTWHDKLESGGFLIGEMLAQFTWAGALLAVIGFAVLLRRRPTLGAAFLLSILMTSGLLIIVRDFHPSYINHAIFSVYHITSYGIMAIALAIGCGALADALGGRRRGMVTAALAAGVVIASIASHWDINNRRHDTWAEDLAHAKLASVDANAFLFIDSDFDLPIGYLHYVKGERPDITVLHIAGLIYGNRLYHPFIPLTAEEPQQISKQRILQQFAANSIRPVFFPPYLAHLFETEERRSDMLGFHRRVNNLPVRRVQLSPAALLWLQENLHHNRDEKNRWTRIQRDGAAQGLVATALAAHWSGNPLTPQWHEIIAQARAHSVRIDMLITAYELQQQQLDNAQAEEKLRLCSTPGEQVLHYIDDIEKSAFYLLCAQLAWHLHGEGDEDGDIGEHYLQRALAQPLSAENPALTAAVQHYREQAAPCRALALLRQFHPDPTQLPEPLLTHWHEADAECDEGDKTDESN